MNRVITHALCFATTLVTGVSVSLFLTFLRLDRSDIPVLAIVDDARSIAPLALPESSSDSTIRQIDFANFTYPSRVVGEAALEAGGFKVRNGELLPKRKDEIGRPLSTSLFLKGVTYGDVTADGTEEAIIDLAWGTGGSSIPDLVCIYGLSKRKPKLLWAFATGDRADGGYKNVFAEHGQLVVELKGKDEIIGRNLFENDGTNNGACCPIYFTRTRYAWVRNRFRQQGESEVLPLERRS